MLLNLAYSQLFIFFSLTSEHSEKVELCVCLVHIAAFVPWACEIVLCLHVSVDRRVTTLCECTRSLSLFISPPPVCL